MSGFLQQTAITTDLSTYTFSSENLGAADAGRYIIVCVQARRFGSVAINSVTVGGVSATQVVQIENTTTLNTVAGIFIAAVPTGTSGDVVVALSNTALRCVIASFRAVGLDPTAADFDTSIATNPSVNLDIPAGGFAIGCASNSNTATDTTWTNLSERSDAIVETTFRVSAADESFVTQQTGLTLTATFTGGSDGNPTGVFASWGPAAATGNRRRRVLIGAEA